MTLQSMMMITMKQIFLWSYKQNKIFMGAQCTAAVFPFKLPDLQVKNTYNFNVQQTQNNQHKFNEIANIVFHNNYNIIKTKTSLLNYLSSMNVKQRFTDPNFQIKGQRLSHLYDLKRKMMRLYTYQNRSGLSIMEQQEIQLSYLSAVLFFLSENKQFLRKRILLTQQINYNNQTYAFRLFCNGQQQTVIVDDIVPVTANNNLKYSVLRQKQIWPVLLQKSWCKMIGSYQKSLGLSPQQSFSQITGLPAFSVRIDTLSEMTIYSQIQKYQSVGSWLCVVAYHDTQLLRPGQVFLIQKIDDEFISLVSPFTQNIKPTQDQTRTGYMRIQFHKFRVLFQYLIIGYIKKNYVPISISMNAQKRQEKLYQIDVKQKEDVSIRFTQFFNGYLDDAEKSNYDYSPLTIFQLYDANGILHFCQGCDRLYSGAHSVYFTKNIFHTLNKGTYFLRLQIDWEYQSRVNTGNIVVYASQNNVQIEQCFDKNQIIALHHRTLDNPKSVVIQDEVDGTNHQYELRFIEKRTNVLISVENKVQRLLSLELNFNNSANFRVKYGNLQSNKKVVINLGPQQTKYLEIMPQNLKKQFKIEPFTVKKLPLLQK